MEKLTALDLYNFLRELHNKSCTGDGPELSKIEVNIQTIGEGNDPETALFVGEDLYDSETNSILTDIMITSKDPDIEYDF